jgi:hypothetical protein
MGWNLDIVICASWDGGLREGGDGLWPKWFLDTDENGC